MSAPAFDLGGLVERFINRWAPLDNTQYGDFLMDVRQLLDLYGKALIAGAIEREDPK